MNVTDLPDESDSSDEDYVPNEKLDELPSEIDEDDSISESEEPNKTQQKKKSRKKKKGRKKDEQRLDDNTEPTTSVVESEDKKAKVDDLWADFVKDTGFKSKGSIKTNQPESSKPKENISKSNSTQKPGQNTKTSDKVKITQIFEFAGEEVKVEKEVSADSAEARLLHKQPEKQVSSSKSKRSAGLSGISNVLNQLSKKPKISTLEKTKLDWDNYKKDHNIEEELQTFNKGKDGYLERQDFLQRTDLRRFEIERDVREVERNKRFNSAL